MLRSVDLHSSMFCVSVFIPWKFLWNLSFVSSFIWKTSQSESRWSFPVQEHIVCMEHVFVVTGLRQILGCGSVCDSVISTSEPRCSCFLSQLTAAACLAAFVLELCTCQSSNAFPINGGSALFFHGSDVRRLFSIRLKMKIVIFSHLLGFCIQTWFISLVFRPCALYYKFFWNCVCQKRHRSSDSTASGRDRSYSTDSADMLPGRLKEEPWLLEISSTFLQQYVQYLQSMGFILVQVRPQSPARRCVGCVLVSCCFQPCNVPSTLSAPVHPPRWVHTC